MIYVSIAAVATLVATALLGKQRVAVPVALILLFVAPMRLTHNSSASLSGVAESCLEITTYGVSIGVLAVAAFGPRTRARLPMALRLFTVYLIVGMGSLWLPLSSLEWSGAFQYGLAPLGFLAGTYLYNFSAMSIDNAKTTVMALTAIMVLQASLALAQLGGLNINSRSTGDSALMEWRVNGTLGHPNTLGKVAFFALLILLPQTRSASQRVSRTAFVGLFACFFCFAASGGRANFLAGLMVVVLWAALLPRSLERSRRSLYLSLASVFALAALITLGARFEDDPTGGSRDLLTESALHAIPVRLWFGMGPNEYLSTMMPVDPISRHTGLPVHNSYLLAIAELGLVGGVLLFWPWLAASWRSFRALRLPGGVGDYSRLMLSASLPIILIAYTGKGMISDGILPLWYLFLGLCWQGMKASSTGSDQGLAKLQQHCIEQSVAGIMKHGQNQKAGPT